jgi:tight adherence protein B
VSASPPALAAVAVVAAVAVGCSLDGALARRRVRRRLADPAHAPAGRDGERRRVAAVGAVAAGVGAAWAAAGPWAVGGLVAVAAAGPVRAAVRRRSARRSARRRQLPGALDRLAAALRTGSSLTTALEEVGATVEPPLGPELAALGAASARGRPLRDVLAEWADAHDDPDTRLAASALVLASVVGSAPARAVDGVAATVRERLDLADERRAMAAQARASALVLSAAPALFAAVLVAADTAAARFLLSSPAGWACLTLGVALDAAGAWWMARITAGERP